MDIKSKLPKSETTIFSVMTALAAEHQAINLGQGFPDYDCNEDLKKLINKYLVEGRNQYCPMPGLLALRESIAEKIYKSYEVDINPKDEITVTAGATQALFTAISAFIHSGDEVIIFEPAYDSYYPSILLAGGIPKPNRLYAPDFKIDWNELKDMITDKTKMIIINSPHNPTGTSLEEQDLLNLQEIVKDKNIIVLSDEVYEHLIYDENQHQSVLKFPQLFQQCIAVYSFGKTFHSTGWKIGYAVGPDHLMKEFRNVHQWNVFSVNSFIQYALADYLKNSENYEYLPNFFQSKRDLLLSELENSPLKSTPASGTYFQVFDYSKISDLPDFEFAKYLTTEIGVAAIPISPFYSIEIKEQNIRLCFAKKESTLLNATKNLRKLRK